ncbi:HVA22-like protein e [Humulus lupulus]|uniref:HVA22-like protein e n=1 Tax=Humulus lupulus TaxID=3486 RepID=UPI002B40B843|nr:HVA22-like protein e [Humulus lupulus]
MKEDMREGGGVVTIFSQLRLIAGPCLSLLYPLYASIVAMESITKHDDEQWLAYWIIYSFLALIEIIIQPALETVSIWYDAKLIFVAWLVLPQFKGASVLYKRFVREQIRKYNSHGGHHLFQGRNKFLDFLRYKSDEHHHDHHYN